ncbi:multinuclear nonheme iron-dependent oxidase [Streptomyces sp. 8N706]|uniref:multinuclear nonheme iron-dependent oxidase n=1 Tax=Streptomyces sp. 8N706 TaxID=3457416 RepID=UPI003FD044EA
MERLGTGIGWRPEIAGTVARLPGLDWVEVVAENICPGHLPEPLLRLRERGTTVVPHGVSLGIGGADRPDPARLTALAERAEALGSPLVTEHIAFVRAGGPLTASPQLEAGHLLPVPRTRDALDVLCENVRIAQEALPVPLALENIAALIAWPGEEMTEGQFLAELVERTGVRLLIDVANLHTNHVNRGEDPATALDELPVEAIAYVHVAGGVEKDGVWHDSHAHPVTEPVLDVLAELCSRTEPPGVLLERDEDFPAPEELEGELDAIRAVVASRRPHAPVPAGGPVPTRGAGQARGPASGGTTAAGADGAPSPREPGEPGERATPSGSPAGAAAGTRAGPGAGAPTEAPRQRLGLRQTALLSALVAGTPAPEGFDRQRLRVQNRALTAKRADVVAKVAPELPEILGRAYRQAFVGYARSRPMTGGYRRDALDFAQHLLTSAEPAYATDAAVRERLGLWWRERSGPAPLPRGRIARLFGAALRSR